MQTGTITRATRARAKPDLNLAAEITSKRVQRQILMATVAELPRKRRAKAPPPQQKTSSASSTVVYTDFMTTREAAAYLKLSRQFLEGARYRGDGSGPAYIKVGRAVRYRRSVLDLWMDAHDRSPDEPNR